MLNKLLFQHWTKTETICQSANKHNQKSPITYWRGVQIGCQNFWGLRCCNKIWFHQDPTGALFIDRFHSSITTFKASGCWNLDCSTFSHSGITNLCNGHDIAGKSIPFHLFPRMWIQVHKLLDETLASWTGLPRKKHSDSPGPATTADADKDCRASEILFPNYLPILRVHLLQKKSTNSLNAQSTPKISNTQAKASKEPVYFSISLFLRLSEWNSLHISAQKLKAKPLGTPFFALPFFSLSSSFRYSKKVKLKRNFREPELQSSRSNLVAAFRINVTPISIQRASTECHESSQRQTKKEKTKCQTGQRF